MMDNSHQGYNSMMPQGQMPPHQNPHNNYNPKKMSKFSHAPAQQTHSPMPSPQPQHHNDYYGPPPPMNHSQPSQPPSLGHYESICPYDYDLEYEDYYYDEYSSYDYHPDYTYESYASSHDANYIREPMSPCIQNQAPPNRKPVNLNPQHSPAHRQDNY